MGQKIAIPKCVLVLLSGFCRTNANIFNDDANNPKISILDASNAAPSASPDWVHLNLPVVTFEFETSNEQEPDQELLGSIFAQFVARKFFSVDQILAVGTLQLKQSLQLKAIDSQGNIATNSTSTGNWDGIVVTVKLSGKWMGPSEDIPFDGDEISTLFFKSVLIESTVQNLLERMNELFGLNIGWLTLKVDDLEQQTVRGNPPNLVEKRFAKLTIMSGIFFTIAPWVIILANLLKTAKVEENNRASTKATTNTTAGQTQQFGGWRHGVFIKVVLSKLVKMQEKTVKFAQSSGSFCSHGGSNDGYSAVNPRSASQDQGNIISLCDSSDGSPPIFMDEADEEEEEDDDNEIETNTSLISTTTRSTKASALPYFIDKDSDGHTSSTRIGDYYMIYLLEKGGKGDNSKPAIRRSSDLWQTSCPVHHFDTKGHLDPTTDTDQITTETPQGDGGRHFPTTASWSTDRLWRPLSDIYRQDGEECNKICTRLQHVNMNQLSTVLVAKV